MKLLDRIKRFFKRNPNPVHVVEYYPLPSGNICITANPPSDEQVRREIEQVRVLGSIRPTTQQSEEELRKEHQTLMSKHPEHKLG